jgi:phosphate/sulfate permease
MRNLGNRITLHSPSRGFTMELGSAITVIMATKLSTSHNFPPPCISSLIIVC